MAKEYAKVLRKLNLPFIVVGRSKETASSFHKIIGLLPATGGIKKWIKDKNKLPTTAIVAVSEEEAGEITRLLIKNGVKKILAEKPGGLNSADLILTAKFAKKFKAKVFIAYNRRFYASTIKAKEIIQKDGGVSSLTFDFTEWSHVIEHLKKTPGVKENWFMANSSHVIDMAFFLGGEPKTLSCYRRGKLKWHSNGAIFTGAGLTDSGALFSYHANWESPGRWGVEILTSRSRLIFRPLEKLQIQKIGSVATEEILLDDKLDKEFKPGVYREVSSFLSDKKNLLTIDQQVKNLSYYIKIGGLKI